jgi:hypothetical protein
MRRRLAYLGWRLRMFWARLDLCPACCNYHDAFGCQAEQQTHNTGPW